MIYYYKGYEMIWYDMIIYDILLYRIWNDMIWYDNIWYMIWYDMWYISLFYFISDKSIEPSRIFYYMINYIECVLF